MNFFRVCGTLRSLFTTRTEMVKNYNNKVESNDEDYEFYGTVFVLQKFRKFVLSVLSDEK